MFINLSNHPSANWSAEQRNTAELLYGEIFDLPFPVVDPAGDEEYIASLAEDYCRQVLEMSQDRDVTVHLMGEMTLTLALVQRLQTEDITCVASTTERVTNETPDGHKESFFKFIQFRKYC